MKNIKKIIGTLYCRTYIIEIFRLSALNCGVENRMEVVCVAVLFLVMAFIVEIKRYSLCNNMQRTNTIIQV